MSLFRYVLKKMRAEQDFFRFLHKNWIKNLKKLSTIYYIMSGKFGYSPKDSDLAYLLSPIKLSDKKLPSPTSTVM